MSLLSKLLRGEKPNLSDVAELLQGKKQTPAPQTRHVQTAAPAVPAPAEPAGEPTPLGRSWGETMPNEPNQYNYPGPYTQYFEDIFVREFAGYRVQKESNPRSSRTNVYTFYTAAGKALVVELVSQHADVYQLRHDCARAGIPYLRFYYDHEGWWNARSYVTARINKALGR